MYPSSLIYYNMLLPASEDFFIDAFREKQYLKEEEKRRKKKKVIEISGKCGNIDSIKTCFQYIKAL
jgi:hypothetical protein